MKITNDLHWYTVKIVYRGRIETYDITVADDNADRVNDVVTTTLLQVCGEALAISVKKNW